MNPQRPATERQYEPYSPHCERSPFGPSPRDVEIVFPDALWATRLHHFCPSYINVLDRELQVTAENGNVESL